MPIKFVAIDFETANARRNNACSLGMIQCENGEHTRKSWLIKPEPLDFHPFNIQIHAITPQMVRNASTFEKMRHEISYILESNIVVAHNAANEEMAALLKKVRNDADSTIIETCINL